MTTYRLKKILISIFCLFVLFNFDITEAATTTPEEIANLVSSPDLQINIPGLNFDGEIKLVEEADGTYVYNTFFQEYLVTTYKYSVVAISVLAVVMIIFAGIQWLTSGGSPDKIKAAQKRIGQAIIGLTIAVLAYTILYTLNPYLTGFSAFKTLYIPKDLINPGEDESLITEINDTEPTETQTINVSGQCFPIAKNSFNKISWNWGDERQNGSRCHAGMDLYTKSPGLVLAADDGVVTRISKSFYSCKSGWGANGINKPVGAIFIYHPSLKITILYAEVDADKIKVDTGDKITKGQSLGAASYCGMLHLELYSEEQTSNSQWRPPAGESSIGNNKCATNFLSNKPKLLLDPTSFVKQTKNNFCL